MRNQTPSTEDATVASVCGSDFCATGRQAEALLRLPAFGLAANATRNGSLMFRFIHPEDRRLPLRKLLHPAGEGRFLRVCEADSFRALVAALLNDPSYGQGSAEARLLSRLRLAEDSRFLARLSGQELTVGDRDRPGTINVASDEPFIRSLDRAGVVSLPREREPR